MAETGWNSSEDDESTQTSKFPPNYTGRGGHRGRRPRRPENKRQQQQAAAVQVPSGSGASRVSETGNGASRVSETGNGASRASETVDQKDVEIITLSHSTPSVRITTKRNRYAWICDPVVLGEFSSVWKDALSFEAPTTAIPLALDIQNTEVDDDAVTEALEWMHTPVHWVGKIKLNRVAQVEDRPLHHPAKILALAFQYKIERLVQVCHDQLANAHVDWKSVRLADHYKLDALMDKALVFCTVKPKEISLEQMEKLFADVSNKTLTRLVFASYLFRQHRLPRFDDTAALRKAFPFASPAGQSGVQNKGQGQQPP